LGGLLAYPGRGALEESLGLVATTLAGPARAGVRQGFASHPFARRPGPLAARQALAARDGLPLPMRYVSKMNRISNDPRLSNICEGRPARGGSWVPARSYAR